MGQRGLLLSASRLSEKTLPIVPDSDGRLSVGDETRGSI